MPRTQTYRAARWGFGALLGLVALTLTVESAGAADPGQMESLNLTATPAAQGIGGPFTVTLTVAFATDPHATLAAHNLTARLELPGELVIVAGNNPVREEKIDLPPTQSSFVRTYQWTLKGTALGYQRVNVTVTTDGQGGGNATALVLVREGIIIGQVAATPAKPLVTEPMTIQVAVTSGFDEATSPLEVWLYVYQTPAPAGATSANGSVVRLTNGTTVRGAGFPMQSDGNGTYRFVIPAQPRGTLIYWVLAETPHSNVTTRPVKTLVEDPAVSGAVSMGALAVVGTVVAAGAAFLIFDPASRKPAKGFVHNSPDRVRMALVVLAVAVALLILAVAMGALQGLWTRLGYA